MDQPVTLGRDLAKSVFEVRGVGADGTAVLRRQLRRGQVLAFCARLELCLIGMAAGSGARHRRGTEPRWATRCGCWRSSLRSIHWIDRFTLDPDVKSSVKRGKTDRAAAEARLAKR